MTDDQLIADDIAIYRAIKDYRLMNLGVNALQNILNRFDLGSHLTYFLDNNRSTASYHNNYHSICVALNCFEGARYENLDYDYIKHLVLAGLFHDFNHSGGEYIDDAQNINRAINGISKAAWDLNLPKKDLCAIIPILKVTKYPYDRTPVTIGEMIIRDADLMQPYEQDSIVLRKQYLGLKTEIEKMRNTSYSDLEYANGQLAWINENVKWNTAWAIEKSKVLGWESVKQNLFNTISGA